VEFDFRGPHHYLEDFVSRIDAPHLERLRASFHREHIVNTPHLSGFVSRTEQLRAMPYRTLLELWRNGFSIRHTFKPSSHVTNDETNWLQIGCYGDLWQIPHLVHISAQLSPLTSSVERLQVKAWDLPPTIPKGGMDPAPWVQLFRHFDRVQELDLYSNAGPGTGIARSLGHSAGDAKAQELFPGLRTLRLVDFDQDANLDSFIAARQHMVLSSHFSPWRSAIRQDVDFAGLSSVEDAESDLDLLF